MPVASLDPTNPRTLTSPTPNPVTPTLTPPHPHPTPHHHSHPLGCKVQRSLIPDHSFMTRPPGAGGSSSRCHEERGVKGSSPWALGVGVGKALCRAFSHGTCLRRLLKTTCLQQACTVIAGTSQLPASPCVWGDCRPLLILGPKSLGNRHLPSPRGLAKCQTGRPFLVLTGAPELLASSRTAHAGGASGPGRSGQL